MNRNKTTLILASGSPRRRQIIQALQLPVHIVNSMDQESRPVPNEKPEDYVKRVSLEKAMGAKTFNNDKVLVIGADTVVYANGLILGKPKNAKDASHMLKQLRGHDHQVFTGYSIFEQNSRTLLSRSKATDVTMRYLSDYEIRKYVESGAPMDKAGAYAIQDNSLKAVSQIKGCLLNAIGLSLCELVYMLGRMGQQAELKSDWPLPKECGHCPLRT